MGRCQRFLSFATPQKGYWVCFKHQGVGSRFGTALASDHATSLGQRLGKWFFMFKPRGVQLVQAWATPRGKVVFVFSAGGGVMVIPPRAAFTPGVWFETPTREAPQASGAAPQGEKLLSCFSAQRREVIHRQPQEKCFRVLPPRPWSYHQPAPRGKLLSVIVPRGQRPTPGGKLLSCCGGWLDKPGGNAPGKLWCFSANGAMSYQPGQRPGESCFRFSANGAGSLKAWRANGAARPAGGARAPGSRSKR